MKKLLLAIALLSLPATALAAPTSWDYASGILQPLQSMWSALVKASRFEATSTTASIFPYASTTVTSATRFCLTGDTCISTWPSGSGSSGFSTTSTDYWLTTKSTSNLSEGSNLYWTLARGLSSFVTNLAATTSVKSITTLPSLSLPYSQLTGTPTIPTKTSDLANDSGFSTFAYLFPGNATSTNITFSGGLTGALTGNASTVTNGVYTTTFNGLFDTRLSATTSLPNITTLAGLSLPYSQLTGAPSIFSYPFPGNATSTNITFSGGLTGALTGNASTATALAANGTNCSAGSYPLGVDASGNAETCTTAATASAFEIATTSGISVPQLAYFTQAGGRTTLGGVSTSTLTATSPLTGSFTQIGAGGSLGCQTASGSQAGCLSAADWTAFNGKSGFAYPFPSNATSTNITFSGGLTGALTGNASTATTLATSRNINGTAFNGSADITITAASSTLLANSNTFTGSNVFGGITFSGITGSTQCLHVNSSGVLSGTGSDCGSGSGASFSYPFPSNATSTLLAFNGGLTATDATTTNIFSQRVTGTTAAFGSIATSSFSNLGALTLAIPLGVGSGGTGASDVQTAFGNLAPIGSKGDLITTTGVAEPSALTVGSNETFLQASSSASKGLAYSKVSLLRSVMDILPVANGGTGSTTLTGILKGAGTGAVASAVAGTDYQAPISLTTTGSSGAATLIGSTLNIPQYAGGASFAWPWTPTSVYGSINSATTTPVQFQGAVNASSTVRIKTNLLSTHSSLGFFDLQRDAQTAGNGYTLMRIKAPTGASEEATLSLLNDFDNNNSGVNERFVDFYSEHYTASSEQAGIRTFATGNATLPNAFVFGFKTDAITKDAGNVFSFFPSGTIGFSTATGTIDKTAKVYIASSTASSLLKVDSAPGTNRFLVTASAITSEVMSTFNAGITALVSLILPNGTAPTVDAAGKIALDTTDNQLLVGDSGGSAFVAATKVQKIWSATVASTSPAFISGGLLAVPVQLDGYTITAIRCYVSGGTSKVIAIEDASANSSEDITCGTTVTSDDGSITNATYTAAELSSIDFGATSGAVDTVSISVFGVWARE